MGFGKGGTGVIITDTDTMAIGTLANNASVKQDNPLVMGADFRLLKVDFHACWTGTAGEGDGFQLYIVDNELSVAEVAECITAAGPTDRNDRVAQERATRPVFHVGTFSDANPSSITLPVKGQDGQEGLISKTIRWTFSDPEGWSYALFNNTGVVPTTGGFIRLISKFYGVWVT